MNKKIKEIWHNALGGFLGSVILIIGLAIWTWLKSLAEGITIKEAFKEIYEVKIRFLWLLLALVLFLIFRKLYLKYKSPYSRKQKNFIKSYKSSIDKSMDIRSEWDLRFWSNGKPYIKNVEMFCLKHKQAPLRLVNKRYGGGFCCPDGNCENGNLNLLYDDIHNQLESFVLNEWKLQ